MQTICLGEKNPYRKWAIGDLKAVQKKDGRSYTQITYLKPGYQPRKDPFLITALSSTAFVLLLLVTFGSIYRSKRFRHLLQLSLGGVLLPFSSKHVQTARINSTLQDDLTARIKNSPSAKRLFKKAGRVQQRLFLSGLVESATIALHMVPKDYYSLKDRKCFSTGQVNIIRGEITISLNRLEDQLLQTYLFELINISQGEKFLKVFTSARQGFLTPEKYAKKVEKIEYQSCKIHHRIVQKSMRSSGWSEKIDYYGPWLAKTFKEHWEYQKHTKHAQRYREALN